MVGINGVYHKFINDEKTQKRKLKRRRKWTAVIVA